MQPKDWWNPCSRPAFPFPGEGESGSAQVTKRKWITFTLSQVDQFYFIKWISFILTNAALFTWKIRNTFLSITTLFLTEKIKGKFVVQKIGARNAGYKYKGVLVCTGSMRETAGEAVGKEQKTPRTTHVARTLKIEKSVLEDYKNTLTPFQKEKPFDREYGCLVDGRPVFYVLKNGRVYFFGHCPNFRIPAIPEPRERAAAPRDFVPPALRGEGELDLAEAIFGFAPSAAKEVKEKMRDGRAGRVFFTDARVLVDRKAGSAESAQFAKAHSLSALSRPVGAG